MLRVLVCGDRHWYDRVFIFNALDKVHRKEGISLIIEGGAKGADHDGQLWALSREVQYVTVSAEWDKYGRAAGPHRNQKMVDEWKPDLVLAFHDDLAHSKGTADMIQRATKAGIEVRQFHHEEKKQ